MKRIFSSDNSGQISFLCSLLDSAKIPYEIRNDAVSQFEPGMYFCQELWILNDADFEEARNLITSEATIECK